MRHIRRELTGGVFRTGLEFPGGAQRRWTEVLKREIKRWNNDFRRKMVAEWGTSGKGLSFRQKAAENERIET